MKKTTDLNSSITCFGHSDLWQNLLKQEFQHLNSWTKNENQGVSSWSREKNLTTPIEFHYSHQGGTYLTCMQLAIKACIFLGLIFFLKIISFSIHVGYQNHSLLILVCSSTFNTTNKPKIFPIRPTWISLHRPWNDLATW